MKKQFIILLTCITISIYSYGQSGLNIGLSFGFPYENYEGYEYSFAFSGDINYLLEVTPAFSLGLASGYGHAFGRDFYLGWPINGVFETPDYQYVPVALAGRVNANRRLVLGADIGYAISVTSAKDLFNNKYYTGGFYWRPMVGFNLNEKFQINANYIGISDDYFYYSVFNIGFSINLN